MFILTAPHVVGFYSFEYFDARWHKEAPSINKYNSMKNENFGFP